MLPTPIKIILWLSIAALVLTGLNAAGVEMLSLKDMLAFQNSQGVEISPLAIPIYNQPPNPIGGLLMSSWWNPAGSPNDSYTWDGFTFETAQEVTEIHWVGGYDTAYFASSGTVSDFVVSIYASVPDGSQPDLDKPLVSYHTGGNAWEHFMQNVGDIAMYDYSFVLPVKFTAQAGVKYWMQIEGLQQGYPNWGIAKGMSGDDWALIKTSGGEAAYQMVLGDIAFTLLGPTMTQSDEFDLSLVSSALR